MSSERLELSAEKLARALDRLDEVLALPGEGPMIDATIQRFEFSFELFWKTLKRGLEEAGRSVSATPTDVLSAAWQADWLDEDEDTWIGMLKDRNRTSHIYDEAGALEIYTRVPSYAPLMRRAFQSLCKRFRLAACRAPSGPSTVREKSVPCSRPSPPARRRRKRAR